MVLGEREVVRTPRRRGLAPALAALDSRSVHRSGGRRLTLGTPFVDRLVIVLVVALFGFLATGVSKSAAASAPCGREAGNPLFVSHLGIKSRCASARVVLRYIGRSHNNLLFSEGTVTVPTSSGRWRCSRHVKHLYDDHGNEYAKMSGTCAHGSRTFAYRSTGYG